MSSTLDNAYALPVHAPGGWVQELGMAGRCGIDDSPAGFLSDTGTWPSDRPGTPWSLNDGSRGSATVQVGQLVRALEFEVIPRLAQSHRAAVRPAPHPLPTAAQIEAFTACLIDNSEAGIATVVEGMRQRGATIESIYLDLFAASARRLGELWDQDLCDFCTVTVGLGRLQRLLRELSPAFGAEIEHPVNGRRALLTQPADEQHSFGLSIVAEFFRRAGWEIHGGPGSAARDPCARVRSEWFDLVGFSIGSEQRLGWLKTAISKVRDASRNGALVVMVGGPLFTQNPQWIEQVGADATARDAREAPTVAEGMISHGIVAKS